MKENRRLIQVGAPDPERKNSPIFDDADADYLSLDSELESGGCYLNDQYFDIGDFVCSGSEMLRCEDRGIWVREGDCVKSRT